MKHPTPRQLHLALAKKLTSLAEDLSYKPAADECVVVDVHIFDELAKLAKEVDEYQSFYEGMRHVDEKQVVVREKELSKMAKKFSKLSYLF